MDESRKPPQGGFFFALSRVAAEPCAGHSDCLERDAFRIGITGTGPVMT
jgi:hypothetical protein